MVAFPLGLDVFANPASTDFLDAPSFLHDVLHAQENDAAWELMSKVGIDASTDINSLDYAMETHTHVPALRDDGGLINHADVTGGTHPPLFVGAEALGGPGGVNDNVLNWTTETGGFDTDSFHDTAVNNSRFTIPDGKSGFYLCFCAQNDDGGGALSGDKGTRLQKNGTAFNEDWRNSLNTDGLATGIGIVEAVAGDYLEAFGLKGAGNYSDDSDSFMVVVFLGYRLSQVLSLSRSRGRSNAVATLV